VIDLLVDILIDKETIEGDRFREIIDQFKVDKPINKPMILAKS
jgi:hypothetical protein